MKRSALAGVAAVALGAAVLAAQDVKQSGIADPPAATEPPWDGPRWSFDSAHAGLIQSVAACAEHWPISVTVAPGQPHAVTIQILSDDKTPRTLYTWKGYDGSVFVIGEFNNGSAIKTLLFYADFDRNQPGGTIIAIDLFSGKELWRHTLKPIAGSRTDKPYSNRIGIELVDPYPGLEVWCEETDGRHIEVLDPMTGRSNAYHVYDQSKGE